AASIGLEELVEVFANFRAKDRAATIYFTKLINGDLAAARGLLQANMRRQKLCSFRVDVRKHFSNIGTAPVDSRSRVNVLPRLFGLSRREHGDQPDRDRTDRRVDHRRCESF